VDESRSSRCFLLFLALTKPPGMLCRNATVKPFLVSLVEPVAYLKSELYRDTLGNNRKNDTVDHRSKLALSEAQRLQEDRNSLFCICQSNNLILPGRDAIRPLD
jgi:hypothetical protein